MGAAEKTESESSETKNSETKNSGTKVSENEKFRGIWISTVYQIDYPSGNTTSSEKLKKEASAILDDCKNMGFNAIILQVRPTADSFYKSDIFPWSKWISGTEGKAPDNGFDPLSYWVEEAHKRGMELHAWLNPYRVTGAVEKGKDPLAEVSENNPARLHPEYTVKYTASDGKQSYYFNPALPEVRKLIVDGAIEIVKNYDVDGIHIDDYFYPGENFDDNAAFSKYGSGFSSKADWRRNNVDLFIKEMNERLHNEDPDIQFGVSPSGIWENKSENSLGSDTKGSGSYSSVYADTRKWASEGWIDYIVPQIYWNVGHKIADYKIISDWWCNVVKNSRTKLYIGLADYKTVGVDSSDPFYNGNEIKKQMEMNASNDIIKGEVHFAYNSTKKVPELKNKIIAQYIKSPNNNSTVNSSTNSNASNNGKIKVIIDGKEIAFDQEPIIESSRTLVPMRAIFEALGAEVEWFSESQKIVASKSGSEITMEIGNKNMIVLEKDIDASENKTKTIILDVPPKIMGSRTLVPLRAVSEVFDADVVWNNSSRTVVITTGVVNNAEILTEDLTVDPATDVIIECD